MKEISAAEHGLETQELPLMWMSLDCKPYRTVADCLALVTMLNKDWMGEFRFVERKEYILYPFS